MKKVKNNNILFTVEIISHYPSVFLIASITLSAWHGFTIKSFAPAWMASITIACCPIAEHMIIFALGSIALISFNAAIPSFSGIVISIVTKSGFSSLYFSTACTPSTASPTTSKPFFTNISLIIILINAASSTTKILLLIFFTNPFNYHFNLLILSLLLTISVTLTPKFSSITTTSPFAISLLFTKISTGSPANLSNSITEPVPSSNISLTVLVVLPNSTVTSNGISNNISKFFVSVAAIGSSLNSIKLAVCT